MRPGALAKLGLGFDDLRKINPEIVFINVSGYGATGPYKKMPSHGIAYDTWSGAMAPAYDEEGFCYIPEHVSVGINATPFVGGLAILAGVLRARETGEGCEMELGQSDAAAYFDWYRIESHMAYSRPEDVVTGNKADNYERRRASVTRFTNPAMAMFYLWHPSRPSGRTFARVLVAMTCLKSGPVRSMQIMRVAIRN
jgi:crotonobetainyl-CoA:carnitine CoA-transferase CaiB-like acyl-CoA transferase